MVLEDRGFLEKLRREVARGHGAATAVKVAVAEYLEAFGRMEDPYLRERAADIRDIGRRIIAHLAGRGTPDPALAAEGILVAAEMLPSDMAALDPARVRGIVTERGEPTSHAAIMARSLGIPALMGVKGALRAINQGDRLILDANSGCVYINPGEVVAAEYRRLEEERRRESDRLEGMRDLPAVSLDGVRVTLRANIGLVSDLEVALRNGADGVGLYRTEFPYMVREGFPSREDQYQLYRRVVEGFGGAPVTIRTLDVGGDKHLPYAVQAHEENPFMGLRSVRFTLENPEIFRTQIEAILMAGAHGPVRILFPLITSLDEVRRCKAVVAGAREALTREGVAFGQDVPLGHHDRGAGGGLAGAGARRGGGLLLGGDERPRAVPAGRRPHEPARQPLLRPPAPGGARRAAPRGRGGAPRELRPVDLRRNGHGPAGVPAALRARLPRVLAPGALHPADEAAARGDLLGGRGRNRGRVPAPGRRVAGRGAARRGARPPARGPLTGASIDHRALASPGRDLYYTLPARHTGRGRAWHR